MIFGCGGRPAQPQAAAPVGKSTLSAMANAGIVAGKLKNLAGAADAAVVLTPVEAREFTPSANPAVMNQIGFEFIPHMLVAQAGQTVRFQNSDDELHNVNVTEVETDTPTFNVATVTFGSYEHTFDHPGFYTVTCDIHTTMRATILVVTSPYNTRTDEEGNFTLENVPAGGYTLTVYAEGAPIVRSVQVGGGRTELEITAR